MAQRHYFQIKAKRNLLSTLIGFLKLRKQRVVLNGQLSSWSNIESGVPQGSILVRLLFLVYINYLLEGIITPGSLQTMFHFFLWTKFKLVSN